MILFKKVSDLKKFLRSQKSEGKKIGFSPTMGALHEGHLALLRTSQQLCDISVVSIFVNPTQFNDPDDLKKYPRTEGMDLALLDKAGCDVVFMPGVEDVYPPDAKGTPKLDLQGLDKVMEGAFRPGHFDGVVQVVKRLLDIVEPDRLFMGQKDFQQFTIIDFMLEQYDLPVELEVVPIVREPSGLAKSSRNVRLSDAAREKATIIYKGLSGLASVLETTSIEKAHADFFSMLEKAGLEPEYLSIANGKTLQPITDYNKEEYVVACTAAWIEGVRLIDNMILKQ
jgi:pantoate--beta-alanine ligase